MFERVASIRDSLNLVKGDGVVAPVIKAGRLGGLALPARPLTAFRHRGAGLAGVTVTLIGGQGGTTRLRVPATIFSQGLLPV